MLGIKKEYIVTDDNKKKAVLIDIDTFNKWKKSLKITYPPAKPGV